MDCIDVYDDIIKEMDEETSSGSIAFVPGRLGVSGKQLKFQSDTGRFYTWDELERLMKKSGLVEKVSSGRSQSKRIVDKIQINCLNSGITDRTFARLGFKCVPIQLTTPCFEYRHNPKFLRKLEESFDKDKLELDILESAIEDKADLSSLLRLPKGCALYSSKFRTRLGYVPAVYEGCVYKDWRVAERLFIRDRVLVHGIMDNVAGVNASGSFIYPTKGVFTKKIYEGILNQIREDLDKGDEDEKNLRVGSV